MHTEEDAFFCIEAFKICGFSSTFLLCGISWVTLKILCPAELLSFVIFGIFLWANLRLLSGLSVN
jgi:hypothetical protein